MYLYGYLCNYFALCAHAFGVLNLSNYIHQYFVYTLSGVFLFLCTSTHGTEEHVGNAEVLLKKELIDPDSSSLF